MRRTVFIITTIYAFISTSFGQPPVVEVVGSPRELTASEYYFIAPKWSPDNTTIAVSTHKYTGIYLISFPEGDIIKLTDNPASGFGLEWSNSGDKIAARISLFENKLRYNAIALFNVISGSRQLISDYSPSLPGTPKWTTDDRFIYLSGTDKFRLFNTTVSKTNDDQSAPLNEKLIFIKKDRIKVQDISSGVDSSIDAPPGRIINLVISPDRTKIAYEIMGGHLWVSKINGENLVNLGTGHAPTWSPRNDKIAFMITTDDGYKYLTSDIYIINIDGTGKVNITNSPDIIEMYPNWSSDGKWIAYDTIDGQIYVQEVR